MAEKALYDGDDLHGKSLHERGHFEAQRKAGNKQDLDHAQFHALDHGVEEHMIGRTKKSGC